VNRVKHLFALVVEFVKPIDKEAVGLEESAVSCIRQDVNSA
jgi:hypothetical protein